MQADFSSMIHTLLPLPVPPPVAAAAARLTGLSSAARTYDALCQLDPNLPIEERLLRHLEVTLRVSPDDLDRVPRDGPVLVVANHPMGILDGAVLSTLLRRIRPDVRILTHSALACVPELRSLIIEADPFTGEHASRFNSKAIRDMLDHLHQGGLLVAFPAGEVAHFELGTRRVADPAWRPGLARLLAMASRRKCPPAIVPIHIGGGNSLLFHAAGLVHPRLRTALLARELGNKKRIQVPVRIGKGIETARILAIPTDRERMDYLRWRTLLLAKRHDLKPNTRVPAACATVVPPEPVDGADNPEALADEISSLPPDRLLLESSDFQVFLVTAQEAPLALGEIGRLRELAFRHAGEGTGRARDLDRFDPYYLHLFVWHKERREIAGAYRLAGTDTHCGGLYTSTLFNYGEDFLRRMGPALELGRSFVRLEYQKSFSPLLLLWKGIGKFVAASPRYRRLFGPVSISSRYQSLSRQLMVAFLERTAQLEEWAHLVRPRHGAPQPPALPACRDLDELSDLVAEIEPDHAGVPVLLRQYLRLGGKLLGFNIDPEFSDFLDGLIVVDLARTERKLLERYLGRNEAQQFLSAQEAAHGTLESLSHHQLDSAWHRRRHPAADLVLQVQRSA
jgi:putative hemolysin